MQRVVQIRRERGIALALVLISLAVCVVVGVAFLSGASLSTAEAQNAHRREVAKRIADSGVDVAIDYITHNADWRSARSSGVWVDAQSHGGGTYTITVEDGVDTDGDGVVDGDGDLNDDTTDPVTIRVVAYYQGTSTVTSAVYYPGGTGSSTIAVTETIELRDNAVIDSYSASAGNYGGANVGEAAIISSNSALLPNVILSDRAQIDGHLLFPVDGDPAHAVQIEDDAVISGGYGQMPSAISMTDASSLAGGSSGDYSRSSGQETIDDDMIVDDFTLSGSASIAVDGEVDIVVRGDLHLSDDARIEFKTGGGSFYGLLIDRSIELKNQSRIEAWTSVDGGTPGEVALASNATGGGDIELKNHSVIAVDVYTRGNPDHVIELKNHSEIDGETGQLSQSIEMPQRPDWPSNVGSNQGDWDSGNNNTHTLSGNHWYDDFEIKNQSTVKIQGDVVLRVDGDFIVKNNSALQVLSGGSLKVYVGGDIELKNQPKVNTWSHEPARVVFYVMSNKDQSIDNNGQVYAIYDMPDSDLELKNQSYLYGAVLSKKLELKNNSRLYLDSNPALVAANSRLVSMSGESGDGGDEQALNLYVSGSATLQDNASMNAGGDWSKVNIYYLGQQTHEHRDSSAVHARLHAPDAVAWNLSDNAQFTGKARVSRLGMSGQAALDVESGDGSGDPGVVAEEKIVLADDAVIRPLGSGSSVIGCNRAGLAAIRVRGSATLKGDARGGPDAPDDVSGVEVSDDGEITGDMGNLQAVLDINAPDTPSVLPNVGNVTLNHSDTDTFDADQTINKLTVQDTATLTLSGSITLVVSELVVRDDARILVDSGAAVKLYVTDKLALSGDAAINVGGNPDRLMIYYVGDGDMTQSGDAQLCAKLVAPDARVSLSDDAEFFGSILAKQLKLEDDAQAHYSTANATVQY